MSAFFTASFTQSDLERRLDTWREVSEGEYLVFTSEFGTVRIRKRAQYPETFAFVAHNALYVGYGERQVAQSLLNQELADVPEAIFFDGEFLLLVADCVEQTVTVQRDAFCTLSLFVGAQEQQLVISSDFGTTCLGLVGRLRVDKLGLMETLLGLPQRTETLFQEVTVLYDRARLVWNRQGATFIEPPDAQAILHAQTHRDADARLFVGFLEETLERYWQRYGAWPPVACDLSGGYDSSLLAGYLADRGYPIIAGIIGFSGRHGHTQLPKIRNFLERFPMSYVGVFMNPDTDYPLVEMVQAGQWRPFYPRRTLYEKTIARLADKHLEAGVTTLLTGIGGDELCQNIDPRAALGQGQDEHEHRRRLPTPAYSGPQFKAYFDAALDMLGERPKAVPLLAYSVMQQHVAAYDVLLDRNIWPVAPLADPRLFMYCQSLPIRYRTQKNILKAYLRARNFPPSLYENAAKEDYSDFFQASVSANLKGSMRRFFQSSVLAAGELIDKHRLLEALDAALPQDEATWLELYRLLSIEINLQLLGIQRLD